MPHVYRHIRLDTNQPFYIGIGLDDIPKRAYETRSRRSEWWNRIANKHGYEVHILFENVSIDFAKEKEKEFISLYGRINLGTGTLCNLTNGGDGITGWEPTSETLEKMRAAQKNKNVDYLMHPDVIAKRAQSNTGKKRTPEQCERLAAWQRGVKKPKGLIEKIKKTKLLPENIEKSRNQINCKKVICINNNTVYRSAAEASRQLGVNRSAISMCCSGVRKTAGNLNFKFFQHGLD
jgi:hypothetical protein